MDANSGKRLLRRITMIHEPTDEVHRETLLFDNLIVVYTMRRDSMGFQSVRVGEHMLATPGNIRGLIKRLPDLQRHVNMCTCENHRDYRMEIEDALQID